MLCDTCETVHHCSRHGCVDTNALKNQVGGSHYKDKAIQPVEYIHANNMGFCAGNVVKYVTRYKDKGGIADLEKAKHYLEILIQLENRSTSNTLGLFKGPHTGNTQNA